MSGKKQNAIFMAKVSFHTKRYDDAISFLKEAISNNPNLNESEQNLLLLIYKKCVDSRRNLLQFLSNVIEIQKAKENHENIETLTSFYNKVFNELSSYCNDLIALIDKTILVNADAPENKIFYYKLKGDFNRYLCEFLPEYQKWQLSKSAMDSYETALRLSKYSLHPVNALYMNTVLNYTVCLYETQEKHDEALKFLEDFLEQVEEIIQTVPDKVPEDIEKILESMHQNIKIWKEEEEDGEE